MIKYLLLFITTIVLANEPIIPIPINIDIDMKKAKLGQELFFDTLLSRDESTSCFSCHNVYEGGADEREVSIGFNNKKGNIQSPTVLNSYYNFKQFWDGRANDLIEQADGPLNNPAEHNMNKNEIEKRLNNSGYKQKFKNIFGTTSVNYKDVLLAIVEFEKALTTPNSKFDRFLRGQYKLDKKERNGYILFKQYGCITCHNGINIGGNSFQKMGTFLEYENTKEYPDRMGTSKNKSIKNVFKVPTLRNISKTAPYFHDASSKTLKKAIQKMAKYNLGIELTKKEISDLETFLYTLNGKTPKILDMNDIK